MGQFQVVCSICGARGPKVISSEDALRLWNKACRGVDELHYNLVIDWLAAAAANAGWQGKHVSAEDMRKMAMEAVEKENENGRN